MAVGPGFLIAAMLPIFLASAAVLTLPTLATHELSGFYPVGLLLSLMLQQAGQLVMAKLEGSFVSVLLGYVYGVVAIGATVAALVFAFITHY
ncbi:hypothetical protein GCM10007418_09500 [Halopseudomonas salina]|uniref:Uncharacterized protein n=1 Tax=Halopseudomonas salina TaxID=1323744 RepID=A0ABQ1P6G4_9GAMM|nr:hypothetical protein GCM10007418_09500 [Halopseudomonas salina]